MQDTSFEELEQTQFPVFPVVFRQEPEEVTHSRINTKSRVNKSFFKMPNKQIQQLEALLNYSHNTTYPELFKESWEDGLHNIDNFFAIYQPLDNQFVEEMKKRKEDLKIVRLSSHKIYIGEFKVKECTGMSIIIFKNGNVYEGMMDRNKRQGKGFYQQSGHGFYRGNFSNDIKTGQGVEVVYKKWAFKGQFMNGLRHQKGLYLDQTGLTYYGQWKLGIMHGKATLRTNQLSYNGMFVNSLKHGQGQQRFQNGDSYKGEYQNNRFDGFGTYKWKQDQATYEGSFKNGLRHGKGKWSSGQTKYSGSYAEGLKEGYGQLYFPSGNFYKGNFVEDKREGYGEMFWTDGSFYKGDWKGGVQNGKGQIYLTGSEVISGLFENGILVQVIPSLYEKQMEISSMGIQDLFGSNPNIPSANKVRTFSESRGMSNAGKKKLAKIEEHHDKRRHSIKDNLYFQTPDKNGPRTNHSHQNSHHNHHSHQNGNIQSIRVNNHNPRQGHTPANRHLGGHNHSHSYQKSGQGRDCKCMRRLQNFRMRQRLKTKLNESKVEHTLHQHH